MAIQLQPVPNTNVDPFILPDPPANNTFGPARTANEGGIVLRQAKVKGLPKCILSDKGFRERYGADGQEVTAEYFVPWTSRVAWVDYMLGYARTSLDPTKPPDDGMLLRTIPYQCVEPGLEHLFAVDVSLTECCGAAYQSPYSFVRNPDGSFDPETAADGTDISPPRKVIAGWPAWLDNETRPGGLRDGWARYTVTFRAVPFIVRTDEELRAMNPAFPTVAPELQRWVVRKRKQALQAQPLPPGVLKFLGGVDIPAAAAYILIPTAELVWEWLDLPDPPYFNASLVEGKVNVAEFDGARGFFSYPAQTLLFQPAQVEELPPFTTGRKRWKYTVTALFRPQGWNRMFDANGVLTPVVYKSNGAPLYAPVDANLLFRPPTPIQYQ